VRPRVYDLASGIHVHKLLCDQIEALGLIGFYEITQASIKGKNGTEFSFVGLKNNVANVKSYEGIDICWVEEAQTVSRLSWNILIPTIRKGGVEIWVPFNPELETDETYQRFVANPPADCITMRVNWSDNPWFPDTLRLEKDALKATGRRKPTTRSGKVYAAKRWMGLFLPRKCKTAEKDGRITRVPYDATKPVHAVFDLGWSDSPPFGSCSLWAWRSRLIRYIEDSQKTISYYPGHHANLWVCVRHHLVAP